jgi:hypothetical protein
LDEVLIEVQTPLGYLAILRRNKWERHELKHPELVGHVHSVEVTLEHPDFVIRTSEDRDHFYAMGHGTGSLSRHYLQVLVRPFTFLDDIEHTVVSAWFTRRVEGGELLWPRER